MTKNKQTVKDQNLVAYNRTELDRLDPLKVVLFLFSWKLHLEPE